MINWDNKEEVQAAAATFPNIFAFEIASALEEAAAVIVGRVADATPVGTGGSGGNLANSIAAGRPEKTENGHRIEWGTMMPHAPAIEYGRRPGAQMPPVEDIARWLWIKGPAMGFDITDEEDAMRIAFVVARKIGRKGFTSGPYAGQNGGTAWKMFEMGMTRAASQVADILDEAEARIARRIN